ncbi:MAG TPA: hypothetical protein VEJ21_05370, partial [Acidimicrobiales bacterium]|nr:hypothetical protein [Acidimicrobiales bacterium]
YGPVVNLAHAVVAVADPGTVLLSDDFHSALLREMPPATGAGDSEGSGEGEFAFRSVRPRPIKDVGRVQLWALYRPGSRPPSLQRGIARRWERLAEVVGDMEELRQRGERLLTGGLRAAVGEGDEGAETVGDGGSPAGDVDGGDAEGSQFEAPVERGQGPAAEIDQPT